MKGHHEDPVVTELCLDCARRRHCHFPGCDLQCSFRRCYRWGQWVKVKAKQDLSALFLTAACKFIMISK